MTKRVLSGMKPTSGLTLGNYLGALKPWVDAQYDGENLFMIADLHAISVPQDPKELHQATLELAASYIAAGINVEKVPIFLQSSVSAHAELGWILTCQSKMGWLNRMTQFKDKVGKDRDSIGAGWFVYPPLMAADILLYQATHVPVGEDQKQHVELTRDLAISFNQQFGPVLTVPEPLIPKAGARIKSLRDGTKKMSKSDASDMSRINLSDAAETIADKIKRAKTDMGAVPADVVEFAVRPEVENLVTIYAVLTDRTPQDVLNDFAGQQFSPFKAALADVVVEKIAPIGKRMADLMTDRGELLHILAQGRDKAAKIANQTLKQVLDAMGFVDIP